MNPAASALHVRKTGHHEHPRAEKTRLPHVAQVLLAPLEKRPRLGRHDLRVVDENVDLTVLGDRGVDDAVDLVPDSHIALHRQRLTTRRFDVGGHSLHVCQGSRRHHDLRALLGQRMRLTLANTCTGSRDDGDSV